MSLHPHSRRATDQVGRWWLVIALPVVAGCGPNDSWFTDHEPRPPAHAQVQPTPRDVSSSSTTRAARAARIATVQAGAGPGYAFTSQGATWRAHNLAQQFDVELGALVKMRLSAGERLSLGLARYGCEGDVQRPGEAAPVGSGNRVEYRRRGGAAGELTEWYVHGPLGLEQGFTLERPMGCGSGGVVIAVGLEGTLLPAMAAGGNAVRLVNAAGRAVARYSDLYVVDATGRELPSTLEVVGRSVRIRFEEMEAVYPIRVDPLVAVEQTKLLASDGQSDDHLGSHVALSGDTLLATGGGKVYVFERAGGTWTEQAKLTASDGQPFGSSVALSGETAAISSKPSGFVDIFVRSGATWTLQATVTASDFNPSIGFGYSVALWGDTLLVGAYNAGELGPGSGAAYVFVRAGDIWTEQAKLLPSDEQPTNPDPDYYNLGAHMGEAVALGEDTAFAGAPNYDEGQIDTGAVYVFTRIGTEWTEETKLTTSGSLINDSLGRSVSVSNNTVVVGTSGESVRVFVQNGGSWFEQANLTTSDMSFFSLDAVAIDGDVVVAGSPETDAAYLFSRTADSWLEQSKILPSDGQDDDQFGTAVAISGDTVVAGANRVSDNGSESGAAYVFVLRLADGTPCTTNTECGSGFCVDDVCCGAICDAGPCDACSMVAGSTMDGTCEALTGPMCDDGNACTQVDTCDAGTCVGASPVPCPSTDVCHDNCDPATGQCAEIAKPNGAVCDDNNACTLTDTCQSGVCIGENAVSCQAPNECHEEGLCDPSTGNCADTPKADGVVCSLGVCQGGSCQPDGEGGGAASAGAGGSVYVVDGGCACETVSSSKGSRWTGVVLAAAVAAGLARRNGTRRR